VAGEPVTIKGAGGAITALPFKVDHGNIDALGFRIGNAAYTPDLNGIPTESLAVLEGSICGSSMRSGARPIPAT